MQPWYYAAAGVVWLLLILRWRYGKRRAARAMLHATGGFRRDKSVREGF